MTLRKICLKTGKKGKLENISHTGNEGNIGNILDPEQEQEIEECQEGDEEINPAFAHLNPDDVNFDSNLEQSKKTFRNIQLRTADERLEEARKLDKYQKKSFTCCSELCNGCCYFKKM